MTDGQKYMDDYWATAKEWASFVLIINQQELGQFVLQSPARPSAQCFSHKFYKVCLCLRHDFFFKLKTHIGKNQNKF